MIDAAVISGDDKKGDSVPVESTDFWREMNENRVGNLLEGYRLKAGLTQAQMAEKVGVRQNMLSDYENGKRRLTKAMAKRFAETLGVKVERFK